MQRFATTILSLFFLLILTCSQLRAAPRYLFKIATLAPAGSVWIEQFDNFAKEIAGKTGGEVGFRMYPGGVMGDDQSMYRKMRVGQLHGGGFTMTGISTVVPDFSVLSIPFLFNSYAEVDFVIKGLTSTFKQRFRDKGLEYIAMTEVGFIYAMSTQPIATFDALKNTKNWSPSGDVISEKYLATLGIVPVQLSIPDVLTSLQSGLVETVYNSFYGSIVLQWFTKARYIADIPYGYAYGVFALDGKSFAKLPEKHQKAIEEAAQNHFPVLLQKTRESNNDSRQVLEKRGSEFLQIDKETSRILREKSEETVRLLIPDLLAEDIYEQTVGLRKKYRDITRKETAP